MAKDKSTEAELQAIEAQVDAMMDVASESSAEPQPKQESATSTVSSAPPVTKEQAKQLAAVEKTHHATPHKEAIKPAVVETAPIEEAPVNLKDLDTPQTDAAIKDIVAQEADIVLAAEDAGIAQAYEVVEEQPEPEESSSGHPIFWFFVTLLVVVIAVLTILLFFPNVSVPFLQ